MLAKGRQKVVFSGLTVLVWKAPPGRVQLVESVLDDAIMGSRLLDGLWHLKSQDSSGQSSRGSSI